MKSNPPDFCESDCFVWSLLVTGVPWLFADPVFPFLMGAAVFGCLELFPCSDMFGHGLRATILRRMEWRIVKKMYHSMSCDLRGSCTNVHTWGLSSIRLGLDLTD